MFLQALSCVIVVAIALLAYRPVEAQDRVRLSLSSISATPAASGSQKKRAYSKSKVSMSR